MSTPDIIFASVCGFVGWTAIVHMAGRIHERKRIADYLRVVQRNTATSDYHTKETSDFVGSLAYCVDHRIYDLRPRFPEKG